MIHLEPGRSISYDQLVFILVKPPNNILSSHNISNRVEHTDLLNDAKNRGLCCYYAIVEDGVPKQPWVLDWDCLPDGGIPQKKLRSFAREVTKPKEIAEKSTDIELEEPKDDIIKCPYCNKKMNSTPGRTLHVKSKHPEQYEEYKRGLNE